MPWVGEINLFSNRRKVLFPEPEGPIIPVMPKLSIATLIFERITLLCRTHNFNKDYEIILTFPRKKKQNLFLRWFKICFEYFIYNFPFCIRHFDNIQVIGINYSTFSSFNDCPYFCISYRFVNV